MNLKRVLEWLAPFSNLDVCIVEQDKHSKISELNLRARHIFIKNNTGHFNKSWAYNVAAKQCDTPVLIFGDADMIMHPNDIIKATQLILNSDYDFVNPYNSVIDLTPQESVMDMNSILQINRAGRGEKTIEKCPITGGVFLIKRNAYLKIGGSCEDFFGWGGEDDQLEIKVLKMLTYINLEAKSYHFHHTKAQIDPELYKRNLSILNHYANLSKEHLQQHINMVIPTIGKLNKFS
jgi:glycosyltransferase involved in cell wall biosynthesis